jgi:hypothetical protein
MDSNQHIQRHAEGAGLHYAIIEILVRWLLDPRFLQVLREAVVYVGLDLMIVEAKN